MTKLLVTGASGLLGANLALEAADAHEVVGVAYTYPLRLPGVAMLQADLSAPGSARRVLDAERPAWVVHCAAAADVERCEREPDWAFRLNETMAGRVAQAAREAGVRLIHISTDAVFDGQGGPYAETDAPDPLSVYAASKLAGERAVAESDPQALIVRTNFFGWNLRPKRNLAEWFIERLERGERCPGFTDVLFSPLDVGQLSRGLLKLLETDASGLLHLPGDTCLSKYEFGLRLAATFGLDPGLIDPVSVDGAGLQARRAKRLCLDGGRFSTLTGAALPSLSSGLLEFRDRRAERVELRNRQAKREAVHERD